MIRFLCAIHSSTATGNPMPMTKLILSVAALTLAISQTSLAQDASVLGAGTRVRLTSPALDSSVQVGRVVSATRDTISFRSDANPVTRTLAVKDLTSIEISGGMETHRGRDALYGLAIGGGAGAILGAATYKKPQNCFIFCDTRGFDAAAGALSGGLVGTLVGAFIVGSFDKTERWVPLRKTASIQIAPMHGGMGVALSARF